MRTPIVDAPAWRRASRGLGHLARTRYAWGVLTATAIAIVASGVVLGHRAYTQVLARRDVYLVVDAAKLDRAVVLLKTASADMERLDLNRNPPSFRDAPVLFGVAHPGRQVFYYEWRETGGQLSPAPRR